MHQDKLAAGIGSFGYRDTWHYWHLVEAQMDYQRRFADVLEHDDSGPFDVIVCPATSLLAWTHGAGRDLVLGGAYTALYNLLGYPAGVIPFTRGREDERVGRKPSKASSLSFFNALRRFLDGFFIDWICLEFYNNV